MSTFFASIALPLAHEGYRVHPLHPGSKTALLKGWPQKATTDKDTILAWGERFPNANVGIATGQGLLVIDEDTDAGGDVGPLNLPPTRTVKTPHGRHFYFLIHQEMPNSSGALGPHIDTRGDGGYVVGPGSIITDEPYEWTNEDEICDYTSPQRQQKQGEPLHFRPRADHQHGSSDGRKFLADALARVTVGNRNATGLWLACQLRDDGLAYDRAEALMIEYVSGVPGDDYTPREAMASLDQAYGKPPRPPARGVNGAGRQSKTPPPDEETSPEKDDEPPAHGPYTLSEMGNAERLVAAHGEKILYCYSYNRWLTWDGWRWADDDTGQIRRLAKQTVRAIYGEAEDVPDDKERKTLASFALRSESAKAIAGMLTHAQSERPVTPDELDGETTDWLLNCANGTLDLRTGARRDADPWERITRMAPISYDASATCPTWLAFLQTIMGGDQALVTFLQRAIGYSLTGSPREEVVFILYGAGMNGKTTLLDALVYMLGDYASIAAASTFMVKRGESIPNDVAALKGARFVSAAETGDGRRLDEELIKRATSETMKARFMRGEFFDIRPSLKLWLATNHKPVIRGTDLAIWRRIRLIPFTVTIAKPDKEMRRKLRAEAAGILAWAVQGCLDWQREGLSEAQAVTAATAAYRAEMDTLAAFIDEACVSGPQYKVSAAALYVAYEAWAKANGEQNTKSQRRLGMALTERGYVRAKGFGPTGAGGWHGIALRTTANDGSDGSVES